MAMKVGGTLVYAWPLMAAVAVAMLYEPPRAVPRPPPEPDWRTQLDALRAGQATRLALDFTPIGDEDIIQLVDIPYFVELELGRSELTVAGARQLRQATNLRRITLRGRAVDDAMFAELCRIPTLRYLNLPHTTLTDAGLAAVRDRPQLVQLRLGGARLSADGLAPLAELKRLRFLHLIDVPISDAGLARLAELEQLESLYLDGAAVSDDAISALLARLPGLHLHLDQAHHDRDPLRGTHGH